MRILPRNSPSLAIVCLATGTLWAVDDPYSGKWKGNPAKSVLTDEMKVTSLGGNKYSFDFGGGSPETIVADGTDQQANSGTTMSTMIVGPNEWRGVRKKDGKVQIRGIWTLSKYGNTLHDDFTYFPDNGKTVHLVYVYVQGYRLGVCGRLGEHERSSGLGGRARDPAVRERRPFI
jgi:hypothetical protein